MSFLYKALARPLLFSLSPETAHHLAIGSMKLLPSALLGGRHEDDRALRVSIGEGPDRLTFHSPVGLAAGFDKDAEAVVPLLSMGFGFMEAGTLTPRPQPGNPAPRIFRFPSDGALVNRLGFNNAGAASAAKRLKGERRLFPGGNVRVRGHFGPLGINIGKNKDTPSESAAADYVACVEELFPYADFFVVNVSSPNTPGLRELQAAEALDRILAAVREAIDARAAGGPRPLAFVKVSPDEASYDAIVETAVRRQFAGIVATNTTKARPEGAAYPADGGLSGRPLRERSTQVVKTLFRAAKGRLAVIGVGGIFTAEDAYEKLKAGASLVEVYTGFVYQGPGTAGTLAQGLLRLMHRDGVRSLPEVIGKGA